jgi:hypothetical protein
VKTRFQESTVTGELRGSLVSEYRVFSERDAEGVEKGPTPLR